MSCGPRLVPQRRPHRSRQVWHLPLTAGCGPPRRSTGAGRPSPDSPGCCDATLAVSPRSLADRRAGPWGLARLGGRIGHDGLTRPGRDELPRSLPQGEPAGVVDGWSRPVCESPSRAGRTSKLSGAEPACGVWPQSAARLASSPPGSPARRTDRAGPRPGQRTRKGTRVPPSNRLYLPPRSGPAGRWPPRSRTAPSA